MKMIGLAGNMEAGKSSLAHYIQDELAKKSITSCICPFAEPLREEILDHIEEQTAPLEAPEHVVTTLKTLTNMDRVAGLWRKPTSDNVRKLLQWWGTDFRRKQNYSYWIDAFESWIRRAGLERFDYIIIDDIRFINEIDFVHYNGNYSIKVNDGKVFWLARTTSNPKDHSSEQDLSTLCDATIDSNCSLEEMFENARKVLGDNGIII